MIYQNLNSKELLEITNNLKNPFYITVSSNPRGEGGKQRLLAHTIKTDLISTYNLNQASIDGIDYAFSDYWTNNTYKGTFELDTEPFIKEIKDIIEKP